VFLLCFMASHRLRALAGHLSADEVSGASTPPEALVVTHEEVAPPRSSVDVGDVDVAIIGAGIGAILAAVKLLDAGFQSFKIFEAGLNFGGTWYWNRYPGCACDIQSCAYLPLVHRVGLAPTSKLASQPDILAHLHRVVDHFGLREHALFDARVTSATLDLSGGGPRWSLRTLRGDTCSARFVLCAAGFLSTPLLPEVDGLQNFEGLCRHTSQWHEGDLDRCRDKVVGVIGTGSSAVQSIPELAKVAAHLYVFQRTPGWVLPANNEPLDADFCSSLRDEEKAAAVVEVTREAVDSYITVLRTDELRNSMQADIASMVRATVKDPRTAEALIPSYPLGCKRIIISDAYLQTFNLPHVTLVADKDGVKDVTQSGLKLTGGEEYALDVLVLATGFEAFTGAFRTLTVQGLRGVELMEAWRLDVRCLYGVHPGPDFPNFMCINGPTSPGVVANVTQVASIQVDHIVRLLEKMRAEGLSCVAATPQALERYAAKADAHYKNSTWTKCNSWYNRSHRRDQNQTDGIDAWLGQLTQFQAEFQDDDVSFA